MGPAKKLPYGNSYADREGEPFCGNECIWKHRATPGTIDIRLPPKGSKGPRVINLFAQWNLGKPVDDPDAPVLDSAEARKVMFGKCPLKSQN